MIAWLTKWFGYIWCGATLLAFLSIDCDPQAFGYFSLIGTGTPWFLLGCFVLAFFWRKSWRLLIPLGCIVVGWSHLTSFVGLNLVGAEPEKPPIRVVSWNLGQLWSWREKPETIEARKKAFFEFLKSEARPDLFCTQEIGGDFLPRIAQETGLTYFANVRGRRTAIFSRWPIAASGEIVFERSRNSCIWADVTLPDGKKTRIFSVHLQSNRVSGEAEKVAEEGSLQEKETWEEVGNIFQKVNRATQKRVRQAEKVAEAVSRSPHPVILAGDLNDTPHSFVYRVFSKRLRDPFVDHALGIGTTYLGSIPALRIDYVLLSAKIKAFSYETFDADGLGDHRPVGCEVALP